MSTNIDRGELGLSVAFLRWKNGESSCSIRLLEYIRLSRWKFLVDIHMTFYWNTYVFYGLNVCEKWSRSFFSFSFLNCLHSEQPTKSLEFLFSWLEVDYWFSPFFNIAHFHGKLILVFLGSIFKIFCSILDAPFWFRCQGRLFILVWIFNFWCTFEFKKRNANFPLLSWWFLDVIYRIFCLYKTNFAYMNFLDKEPENDQAQKWDASVESEVYGMRWNAGYLSLRWNMLQVRIKAIYFPSPL